MRKAHMGLAAVAALALAMSAGCSTGNSDAGQTTQGQTNNGTTTGSGNSGDTSKPVTLTYWDFIDPSQDTARSKALKANIEAFQDANPGITVQLEVVSFGDMLSRLPQAAAAGQTPDVVKMYSTMNPQVVSAGVYQPLPEAVASIDDWLLPVDDLVNKDGQQIAVPYEYRTCSLLYNEKILTELGEDVPTTWDDVVTVAGKAGEAGYVGFGSGFSEVDNSAIIAELFDCFMTELDQPITDDSGALVFDTPKAQEFSDFLVALKDVGGYSTSVVADQYSTVTDGLSNGTVAMAAVGTHRIGTVQAANPDVKWTSLPAASNGSNATATFGWTLGVGSGSKNADAAGKFIAFMTSPEAAARMATGGEVPTRAASYEEDFFSTPDADDVLAIRDYVEKTSVPRTYPENWLAISTGLARAGQTMYLNGTPASELLANAVASANG